MQGEIGRSRGIAPLSPAAGLPRQAAGKGHRIGPVTTSTVPWRTSQVSQTVRRSRSRAERLLPSRLSRLLRTGASRNQLRSIVQRQLRSIVRHQLRSIVRRRRLLSPRLSGASRNQPIIRLRPHRAIRAAEAVPAAVVAPTVEAVAAPTVAAAAAVAEAITKTDFRLSEPR